MHTLDSTRAHGINTTILSIIVCMYNEEQVIDIFFDTLLPVLGEIGEHFEVICVNDGSKDGTFASLIERNNADPRIKIIDFSRNFGKEIAMTAGLDYAAGEAIIFIDADLQDPPELIPEFVQKWKEGYEIVYGIRSQRKRDTVLKRMTASLFYRLFNRLGEISLPVNAGDFRLLSKKAADSLKGLRERRRFMKGLFAWVGYEQIGIPYERSSRAAGTTKWNYWKLFNFAIEGLAAYSSVPLRLWTYVGFGSFLFSCMFILYMVYTYFFIGGNLPGFYLTIVSILFFGGLQMMTLGIIGEYISRIYDEVKGRPLYIVNKVIGFSESPDRSEA